MRIKHVAATRKVQKAPSRADVLSARDIADVPMKRLPRVLKRAAGMLKGRSSIQKGAVYQRAIRKEWQKRSERPLHTK